MFKKCLSFTLVIAACWLFSVEARAQGTVFTYQGKLTESGSPATGQYDFQFKLYDALTAGTQHGGTVTVNNVTVTAGIFTVQLDFVACASCFNGAARFLEIAVKPTSGSTYTMLSPRQPVTSTPYAIRSLNATAADGLSVACINCVTSSQIQSVNGSAVSGTIPVASVPALSGFYIQNNSGSPQANANFNIEGSGTAGTLTGNLINTVTQYNLGGARLLSSPGTNNLFAGLSAGAANTGGTGNVFVGTGAGQANTTSSNNSYVGFNAGLNNTTTILAHSNNSFFGANAGKTILGSNNSFFGSNAAGNGGQGNDNAFFGANAGLNNATSNNSFFGSGAGQANTGGDSNAFFGTAAGNLNSTASFNSFFGSGTGQANTGGSNSFFGANAGAFNTADGNSMFGFRSGFSNTSGANNSFFGGQAGENNTTGAKGAFFGYQAGQANTTGGDNTFLGYQAGQANTTGSKNAFFGSGAGTAASTDSQNSFFGYQAGNANNGGTNNSFFGGAAGSKITSGSTNSFFGAAAGLLSTTSSDNSFFGNATGFRTNADGNSFFGSFAGSGNTLGSGSTMVGFQAGLSNTISNYQTLVGYQAGLNTTGAFNTFVGSFAGSGNGAGTNITAIGASADVGFSNLDHATAIGAGAIAPASNQVQIGRNSIDKVSIGLLGSGAATPICMANSIFSLCSSSLRYKENIEPFGGSLSLLQRLRPVVFDWKSRKEHDLGLIAEEVFEVEPLLVTHNDKGEIEGVKYDKLTIVLINAIKDQQTQIEDQRERIHDQQQQIEQLKRRRDEFDALKRLVCADHPKAALCKEN